MINTAEAIPNAVPENKIDMAVNTLVTVVALG
jgi:hypothetical protein